MRGPLLKSPPPPPGHPTPSPFAATLWHGFAKKSRFYLFSHKNPSWHEPCTVPTWRDSHAPLPQWHDSRARPRATWWPTNTRYPCPGIPVHRGAPRFWWYTGHARFKPMRGALLKCCAWAPSTKCVLHWACDQPSTVPHVHPRPARDAKREGAGYLPLPLQPLYRRMHTRREPVRRSCVAITQHGADVAPAHLPLVATCVRVDTMATGVNSGPVCDLAWARGAPSNATWCGQRATTGQKWQGFTNGVTGGQG